MKVLIFTVLIVYIYTQAPILSSLPPVQNPNLPQVQNTSINVPILVPEQPRPKKQSPNKQRRDTQTQEFDEEVIVNDEPIPTEFWVFLFVFVGIIFIIVRKSKKQAESRTVIARREDFKQNNLLNQINYHEAQISRLQNIMRQYQGYAQNSPQPRVNYPAHYEFSMEMSEHPRNI